MNELLKERLISLFSEPSQVTNQEMQCAYEYFIKRIENVNQSGNDCSKIYRILNSTRIELVSIQTFHQYEQEKKCPKIYLSS
ncbi:hypothetical protein E2605_04855 [Dysgonomonas capnocytophagoides]|uniref:Uncharacterized protein n=1 Tax=Dysgonomonas capnocytophagoides TaxID=45254 RepID=A0A4Y8LA99_9BACT|nr:hypothetical protein [Dysgonomonas capnocytophagoides]TFD97950.1 hypothetical protein E2605_04855 [Dysgonomonas capnocytophagoides]